MMFSSILMALPLVDFEHVILGNIKAPAHFLVVLTPSALERCDEPADWLRREIETALDIQAQYCAPHAGRLPASASFYPHLLDRASWQPVIGIREYREQLLIARYRGARYLSECGERQKVGGQAAFRSGSCVSGCDLNFGYQRRNRSSRSSLRTLVLVCSKRCAPRSVHCICCFLTNRLLTT